MWSALGSRRFDGGAPQEHETRATAMEGPTIFAALLSQVAPQAIVAWAGRSDRLNEANLGKDDEPRQQCGGDEKTEDGRGSGGRRVYKHSRRAKSARVLNIKCGTLIPRPEDLHRQKPRFSTRVDNTFGGSFNRIANSRTTSACRRFKVCDAGGFGGECVAETIRPADVAQKPGPIQVALSSHLRTKSVSLPDPPAISRLGGVCPEAHSRSELALSTSGRK